LKTITETIPKTFKTHKYLLILLSGEVFLATFMILAMFTYFTNNEIEDNQLENLVFYGIFVIILATIAITLFAMKVKKIKSQFVVGLSFILIIFVVQTIYDNSIDNEMIQVLEYHDLMSTPAITALDNIAINFEIMHRSMHGYVLDHEHALIVYDVSNSQIRNSLDNYVLLVNKTNGQGENLADPKMQQMMLGYIGMMENSLNRYNSITEDFISQDFQNDSQIKSMFNGIDVEAKVFRGILNDAKQMEINGKIKAQNKIDQYSQMGEYAHLLSIVFVILTIISVVIVISNSMKNNIKSLKEITSKIAKGDLEARVKLKDKTEFSEIGKQINYMAAELKQYQEQSLKTEKLKSIGELASRLGHDLRNPLSTIKTTSAVIKMKAVMEKDDKYTKNLASIDAAVDRMTHQIESVLDFVRTKPLDAKEDSIYDIIQKTIETIKVPQDITINLEKNDVKITCDSQRLGIVFTNLITNSIQAIGENSGEITIGIKENQGKIICKVIDSGPGIPQDTIGKVFEPLFTTKQTGTGLGLSSCISIVQQHNGIITVHNNPTTFTVTLPKIQLKSLQWNEMVVRQ